MKLIHKAAEAFYPTYDNDFNYERRRDFISDVQDFLSYLSQQGDEELVENIMQERYNSPFKCHPYGQGESAYFHEEGVADMLQQALAIGRASNRWIPVTERLPEEKDGRMDNDGSYWVDTCWWNGKDWDEGVHQIGTFMPVVENLHWRTPSAYPQPPKSEV